MIPNIKHLKILVALMAVMVAALVLVPSAFAECGPGFSSKHELIQYVKSNPSYAHGLRKELLKHSKYTGYQADETVLNYLRGSEQVVKAAPAGYKLKSNTWCPGGAGKYKPYHGLYDNMGGKLMLWHCVKGGKCVPLLKGYCMNFVMGPGIGRKKRRHKHHHRQKKPPHKHGKETCHSNSKNGGGGNCNHQETTVTAEQKCGAENHSTTGCIQETTTVVINCGNYSSENSGSVNQGGNCNNGGTETCVGQSNCNETHEETCVNDSCNETPPPKEEEKPCGCEPKSTIKITSMTELNQIPEGRTSQEVHIGTYASESGGVLTVDPGIGSVSACGSSTPKGTFTADVPSGSSEACVIFYAPEDGDEPEYMVVTVTACLGSLCSEKTQKVKITYPKRPS